MEGFDPGESSAGACRSARERVKDSMHTERAQGFRYACDELLHGDPRCRA
jgi:hypothetical protein